MEQADPVNQFLADVVVNASKVDVIITDEDGQALAEGSFKDSGIAVL